MNQRGRVTRELLALLLLAGLSTGCATVIDAAEDLAGDALQAQIDEQADRAGATVQRAVDKLKAEIHEQIELRRELAECQALLETASGPVCREDGP